jgi:probable rRNA maturation factor
MRVIIKNQQKDLKISASKLKKLLAAFLKHKDVLCAEVIIHYVSEKRIGQIHKTYFDDESPTDCISLPIDSPTDDSPFSILGEVIVCPKIALDYARSHKGDPEAETLLYTVHGLLHLLGYDDQTPTQRKTMRREEKKALTFIKAYCLQAKKQLV